MNKLEKMAEIQQQIKIGRAPDNTVVLSDASVSGYHAILNVYPGKKYFLIDCQSSNGTYLQKADCTTDRLNQSLVTKSDRVVFGSCLLTVPFLLECAGHIAEEKSDGTGSGGAARQSNKPRGTVLLRCECGAMKKPQDRCDACGRQ